MKAAIHKKYGHGEVIEITKLKDPKPKANEILVRVHACTVNRSDCAMLSANPFIMRFPTGLFGPAKPISGTDFSGVVESTGEKVNHLKPGDKVFGFDDGGLMSHAEMLTISAKKPVIMPVNVSFETAAASIEGAHYAYNFITKVNLKKGDQVLVNGASGAIGSAMVQLLRYFQAEITAVCNTKNMDLIRSMGVEKVIDYTTEDFTKDGGRYDYVFDTVGKSIFSKCKPLLKPKGVYISSELGPWSQNVFLSLFTPWLSKKKVKFPIPYDIKGSLEFIKSLLEEESFKPVIERVYPLEETGKAFDYVFTGQKTGNVVLKIQE